MTLSWGYTTKFVIESISNNTDFATDSWTMNSLPSGTDDIVSVSIASIGSLLATSISTTAFIDQGFTYIQSSTSSDVYFQILTESISVVEGSLTSMTLSLSCSFSGSTSIIFGTGNYRTSTTPAWVSINPTTGTLSISAPNVNSDTEYDFYITSLASGFSSAAQKLVKLTVANCQVQNWQLCSTSSALTWTSWVSGYTLASGAWIIQINQSKEVSKDSQNLRIATVFYII